MPACPAKAGIKANQAMERNFLGATYKTVFIRMLGIFYRGLSRSGNKPVKTGREGCPRA